jgi:hypothetical protein
LVITTSKKPSEALALTTGIPAPAIRRNGNQKKTESTVIFEFVTVSPAITVTNSNLVQ